MKLELKHIVPYVPYGLNWDISELEYGKIEAHRLTECKLIALGTEGFSEITVRTNIKAHNEGILFLDRNVGKPIFHPLSDLTNEIEINGDKFIPNDRLREITGLPNGKHTPFLTGFFWGSPDLKGITYDIYTKLFEWHIDLFGLIPEGLAVDINTLDKEK